MCVMCLWIPIRNYRYEKKNLEFNQCVLVRRGRLFSFCFVASVGIIMGELTNSNAFTCRGDEEILRAGSGGKGSAEGQSFQPIQPKFIAATV